MTNYCRELPHSLFNTNHLSSISLNYYIIVSMMSLFTILLYTCLFSPLFIVYVFMCEISACLLTLSAHAREGYRSAFSVCL